MSRTDLHLSNWFPILNFPKQIFYHVLKRKGTGRIEISPDINLPYFQQNQYIVTFYSAKKFNALIPEFLSVEEGKAFEIDSFLQGKTGLGIFDSWSNKNVVTRLFNITWALLITQKGLPIHNLANGAYCSYFLKDMLANNRIDFLGVSGKTWRRLVGYKTIGRDDMGPKYRYWHFGLEARLNISSEISIIAKPHVIFSSDGREIWESDERLHRARRSQCKDWWNADWRDRILGFMWWLTNGEETISLPLTDIDNSSISLQPIPFVSSVDYTEPGAVPRSVEVSDLVEPEDDEYDDELEAEPI